MTTLDKLSFQIERAEKILLEGPKVLCRLASESGGVAWMIFGSDWAIGVLAKQGTPMGKLMDAPSEVKIAYAPHLPMLVEEVRRTAEQRERDAQAALKTLTEGLDRVQSVDYQA